MFVVRERKFTSAYGIHLSLFPLTSRRLDVVHALAAFRSFHIIYSLATSRNLLTTIHDLTNTYVYFTLHLFVTTFTLL